MEIVEEKKSGAWKVVLAIFLTTIIIGGAAGAGAFFWQQMEIDNQKSDKDQLGKDKDGLAQKATELENEMTSYKTAEETATKKSLELTPGVLWLDAYKNSSCLGDTYINGVVQSNQDKDITYFATSTTSYYGDITDSTCVVGGIEEVNYKNSITKVYSQKYASVDILSGDETKEISSSEREGQMYQLIGTEGDKLIFIDRSSDVDNSPGPCVNLWTEGRHYSLDLNDVTAGMKEYTVPDGELLEQEKKRVEECSAEI